MQEKHDWSCDWTWDITTEYHLCPKCNYIQECRKAFKPRQGVLYKELQCNRCSHLFEESKKIKPMLGPLL